MSAADFATTLPLLAKSLAPQGEISPRRRGGKTAPHSKSSFPSASRARLEISAFLFRLPFTR